MPYNMHLRVAGLISAAAAAGILLLARRKHRDHGRRLALRKLCAQLPKAELHAHLHGCARLATIAELAPSGVDTSHCTVEGDDDRSLDACFAIFGAIHKTVTNLANVRRVAREVLEDFAADNVKYLELRTTPRALSDADVEGYVLAVLGVFADFEASQRAHPDAHPWPMTVRLLLSIDRTGSEERAMETVKLAQRLRAEERAEAHKYIVGVDFSGNPTRGTFATFASAFEAARAAGLRIAVHAAEVPNAADNASILAFRPDRLGHALLLSEADVAALQANPIPIELCPTSNLMTLKLASLRDHPTMGMWLGGGYPVSISTDDSTVFRTNTSEELALTAEACGLSASQLIDLALAPLAHAFEPRAAISELRAAFERDAAKALANFRWKARHEAGGRDFQP
jgi:adenosine deaminase